MLNCGSHTQTIFCVVFKQGVCPCRTMTVFVCCVRHRRCGTTPDGGAACCVCNVHSVTEQLSYQFCIRCFTTTCASAGELKQRLFELRALNGFLAHRVSLMCNFVHSEIPVSNFSFLCFQRLHFQSLVRSRTYYCTAAAAQAVQRGNLHSVFQTCKCCAALCFYSLECCGSLSQFFVCYQNRSDCSVRTYIRALVTLDTVFSVPFGYVNCNTTFFVSSCTCREVTVFSAGECGYGQLVAFLCVHGFNDILNEFCCLSCCCSFCIFCSCPGSRDFNLNSAIYTTVNSSIVHVQDCVTLLTIGFCDSCFHVFYSLINGDDVSQLEECSLQNCVDSVAQTDFACDSCTIDDVEVCILSSQLSFQFCGQLFIQFVYSPCCVQQECTIGVQFCNHVVQMNIFLFVTSNEVCCFYQICRSDGCITETQVRLCNTTGFFGVIAEVCLCIFVCMVTNDLDGVLVCTYSTVSTQTPEFAGDCAIVTCNVNFFANFQGCVCHVIHDTQCEVVFGFIQCQVCIYCQELCRCNVLGTQTVTAANYNRSGFCFKQCCTNVHVQRFALCAGFFCSVQNSDLLRCCRDNLQQLFCYEGTEQMYLNQTNLFALCCQVVDCFFDCFTSGAHSDDDSVSISCTIVVEQSVISACDSADFAHVFFYYCGQSIVEFVCCFTALEVDIGVLSCTSDNGMFGVQRISLECVYCIHINDLCQFIIVDAFNLLDFVRCTETIEEVQERYTTFDCGQVCNASQIHNFLYGVGNQHSETCLTTSHNVGVITEDGQCMCSQSTCCYVEYAGQQFAGNFVHIGDHQQQTLRCCVCGCQRTGCQRAVYCTGSTCFRLHFYYFNCLTKKVLFTIRCPVVCFFSHGRGRCDGEDTGNFCKRIGSVCSSFVTVHRFHYFRHFFFSSFKI